MGCSAAEPAITNEFRGDGREESESSGEVEAGHEGGEVSHFPSCEAVQSARTNESERRCSNILGRAPGERRGEEQRGA